jgi:rSAM/selenodomain-associated transferase 1
MSTTIPRVLGLFAKQPSPSQVKTRLAAATSPEWAARVAEAFLRDTLNRLLQVDARRFVVFAPVGAASFFLALAGDRFELTPQCPGHLGQRMAGCIAAQIEAGAEAVVLVGTDSPTLPTDLIEQAFRELERADLVLGPATDGGYYLIGCGRRLPPVFEGIDWSSSRVLGQTVAALAPLAPHPPTPSPTEGRGGERQKDSGARTASSLPPLPWVGEGGRGGEGQQPWRLAVLPPWYDVDTLDDWWMLRGHVAALRHAGIDPGLPATEALLHDAPS